jgi:hypothetical protein
MAGQITHMEIAYRLKDRLEIEEGLEQYILGSVAPDSVHFAEDYLRKKIHSHLFENCGPWGDTQDYDHWIENIRAFWAKYVADEKDILKRDFFLGFCVHCLTDYWNDLLIWRALQKKNVPPMDNEDFKAIYGPEYTKIDRWLFQNISDADIIMKLLADSKEEDFEDYAKKVDMTNMKKHLINTQYNLPDPVDVSVHNFCMPDSILKFVDEVPGRVYEQLRSF